MRVPFSFASTLWSSACSADCSWQSVISPRGTVRAAFFEAIRQYYRKLHRESCWLLKMTESDDDEPQLSQTTLAALQDFYKERDEREKQLNKILTEPGESTDDVTFEENWQLSQFWYDEKTVDTLIKGAIKSTPPQGKIALVSCPTLYKNLKKQAGDRIVTLFEYDQRFSAFGKDFVFYDYKSPLLLPREMSSGYDLVIADPPFLSEECLTKTSVTVRFLTKNNFVICTGAVMADLVERLLGGKKCIFEPHHKNNLANEFWCYSNFDFDEALN